MSLLEVKNLSFGYGKNTPFSVQALKNISFRVEEGELVSVIGHTGSGKSTLMQMLNALLTPDEGEVLLNGKNIHADKRSVYEARFLVGLCFQYPEYQLFGETCEQDIAFGPKNMGLDDAEISRRVRSSAAHVGLDESLLKASPFDLSGGQKRRCAIAGVMAMQPKILILDEPTAGLDPAGRRSVLELILRYRENTGSTVILVTHSMEIAAAVSDRILVLNRGELAYFDTPAGIFRHAEELIAMGLNVPSFARVISALRAEGLPVDDAYTLDAAADAICASLTKGGAAV